MKTPIKKNGAVVALLVLGLTTAGTASAQAADPQKRGGTSHASGTDAPTSMAGMDHSQMDHSRMDSPETDKTQNSQADKSTSMEGMDHSQMDHSQMGHSSEDKSKTEQSGMDHSQMNHVSGGQQQTTQPASQQDKPAMKHSMAGMGQGMPMGPMQGGSPSPDARDPDAYAEGTNFASLPGNEMHDDMPFGRILLDKFEYAQGDGERGWNIDGEAWYGNDYDKAWLKAEGARRGGRLQSLRTEALWDRTFATFWSTQLGVRHDSGGGDSRNWLAFGVRGLAPYWFDTEATAYWSGRRLAARLKVRYELLFTQQLILEPEVDANLSSKVDPARGMGSGLTDLELGLRLRYEIRRQLAPYIGVTWSRNFGDTVDYARAKGDRSKTFQVVGGVRFWF